MLPERPFGPGDVVHGPTLLAEGDIYLFKEGSHFKLHDKLGDHPMAVDGRDGTHLAAWAPHAASVAKEMGYPPLLKAR